MQKIKSRKKKRQFNDLLLPLIFTLCVLPFTVYLAEYDYGYGDYDWHSANSVMLDFYTYYRGIFFLFIVFFAAVILLFRFSLYRESIRNCRIFLPLCGYCFLVVLSSLFSRNPKAAWLGNFADLEGAFILIGYCIIGFYAYQIYRESDSATLIHAVWVMFFVMSIVGWFQVAKRDLLNYDFMQRITMPDALYQTYGGEVADLFSGNNVFLTLYNPNYAAVFLVMFSCVFFVLAIGAKRRRDRVIHFILLADALILCWFTYTRAALIAIAVILVILCAMLPKGTRKRIFILAIPCGAALLAALLFLDGMTGRRFTERLFDEKKDTKLTAILTDKQGVSITYDGVTAILSLPKRTGLEEVFVPLSVTVTDENGIPYTDLAKTEDGSIILPFSDDAYADCISLDGETVILVYLCDYTLTFVKEPDGYSYQTEWGKTDKMVAIPHADFHGLEYLGSGRLYIWSRVLPLLPRRILLGSGPDTFAEVYPQNDYAGKLIYAESTARIMERAHNDYLMRWVQTGGLSVLCLLAFYVMLLRACVPFYRKAGLQNESSRLGFGCFLGCVGYLVCAFFTDSTLYTTPTFYVFAGIALAAASS